jgi:hypothetical protein
MFYLDVSSTLCVVDAQKDFEVVASSFHTIKPTSLADMHDLFDAEVLQKVFASRLLEKGPGA